jgi:hypothetical protein
MADLSSFPPPLVVSRRITVPVPWVQAVVRKALPVVVRAAEITIVNNNRFSVSVKSLKTKH